MIDLVDPSERAANAGEYVLGTLEDDDRAAFEVALAGDRALRAAVYRWQDRLLGLTATTALAAPPAGAWDRIEAALADSARASAPSRPAAPRTADPPRPPWWQRLDFLQGLSVAGLAASLLLAVLLVGRVGMPEAPGARYVAVLLSPDAQSTGYVVEIHARGELRLVPVGSPPVVPPGRALQFWTKAESAAGPTSLGLVRPGQVVQMPASRLPAVEARQLFEITLEPEAGSPLDRPTGPILFLGRTVAVGT